MPVTTKRRNDPPSTERDDQQEEGTAQESEATVTRFVFRNHWFVLSQTDGEPYHLPPLPAWEKTIALETLGVQEVPFVSLDGNSQGYAQGRSIAINPVAALPYKTLFHELAHIMLRHTTDNASKEARPLNEAEAEIVALLCLESLGLPGAEYSRGYVQHWLDGARIPERSAQKIFSAADMILKTGTDQNIEPGANA
jgi:antirestriction protein ArdC